MANVRFSRSIHLKLREVTRKREEIVLKTAVRIVFMLGRHCHRLCPLGRLEASCFKRLSSASLQLGLRKGQFKNYAEK